MGKQLSTPTSTFAVEYTKQASNHAVKFPVSAMNTEVEGNLQSFLKITFQVSLFHHSFFHQFSFYKNRDFGLMEWKYLKTLRFKDFMI